MPARQRALDELGLDRYERTSAERSVSPASPSAVAEGFRASPGTLAIGDRARSSWSAAQRDADAPDVELPACLRLPTGETVVDIAQYTAETSGALAQGMSDPAFTCNVCR